jgi:purine-binding chemotaxis protein CheW
MSQMAEISGEAAESEEVKTAEKYLIFSILGKLFSFPSRFIGEIALFDTVYPLPLMPAYVPGVVNRYSVPYALFDIGLLFYSTPCSRSKVLVIKDEIDRIAFLIDDVSGIADVPQDGLLNMERGPDSGDITDAVSASFNWNGSDVLVLDINRILAKAGGDEI